MAKCSNCKGKGTVHVPRKQVMPGSVRNLRRAERNPACPDCNGSGQSK